MRLLQWEEDDLTDMPGAQVQHDPDHGQRELQKVVREMIPNGELLRITCQTVPTSGDQHVTFSSSGEAGDMSYEVDLEQDGTEIEDFDNIDMEVRRDTPQKICPCIAGLSPHQHGVGHHTRAHPVTARMARPLPGRVCSRIFCLSGGAPTGEG